MLDCSENRHTWSNRLNELEDLFENDLITLKRVNWLNELNEIDDLFKNRPDYPKRVNWSNELIENELTKWIGWNW